MDDFLIQLKHANNVFNYFLSNTFSEFDHNLKCISIRLKVNITHCFEQYNNLIKTGFFNQFF